ncbi:glutaredoxin domain-containing protein [Pseudarthrobacter sp. efr-133-R2A-89]|uniref:glutaredoxin family protein n=1 Tax=Pseudarthrobacter sp. efr-133-R2A-89 TaxID=3040302 RepID=UPI002556F19B|nr:glutaredoxin domain-containing protein [Pseudarthrobacter sp. efr-133-R2A-89]
MSAAVLEARAPVSEGADFTLEIYSMPTCVQCGATYRKASKLGIQYVSPVLSEHSELHQDAVREHGLQFGAMTAPLCIVRAADGTIADGWGGFDPGKDGRVGALAAHH